MAVGLKSRSSDACVLRFTNQTSAPVRVLWLDYEGKEVPYGIVQPHCSFNQATFSGHPWRLRDEASSAVLAEYVGPTATIIVQPDGGHSVTPGLQRVPQAPVSHPVHGTYRQRGEAMGIPILAFDCVSQEAVGVAAETICYMLADVDDSVVKRMLELGAEVAIIGCKQVTTDIPPHSHLRGLQCGNGGGTYDESTRGLGGHVANPTTSVGEENLTMSADNRYVHESILVHEFAHAVMDLGLHDQPLKEAIVAAFRAARLGSLGYDLNCYCMLNESEYWAEMTQAWFNATVRTDVTSGITTRETLKARDPQLAEVMARVWGDGPWRYPSTAPRPFAHYQGRASQQQQQLAAPDYTLQSHAERLWQPPVPPPQGYPGMVNLPNGGQTTIVSGSLHGASFGVPWHYPGIVGVVPGQSYQAPQQQSGGGFWSSLLACLCCTPQQQPGSRASTAELSKQPILAGQPPSVEHAPQR